MSSITNRPLPDFSGFTRIASQTPDAAISSETISKIHKIHHRILADAQFLSNGGESAVFIQGDRVLKIPIGNEKIKPQEHAINSINTMRKNYEVLLPIFQSSFKNIRLTPTEFHGTYMSQPYIEAKFQRAALTPAIVRELRQIVLSNMRTDVRPSNFRVDKEGFLQLVDFNLPEEEDPQVNRSSVVRMWNAIGTAALGDMLTVTNDAEFELRLLYFFQFPPATQPAPLSPKKTIPPAAPTKRKSKLESPLGKQKENRLPTPFKSLFDSPLGKRKEDPSPQTSFDLLKIMPNSKQKLNFD